jgi:type II secretory pathway pseudopilin PulG
MAHRVNAIRDDRGYSLVEMLVTIIMFTLVAGSITAVVVTTLKHQNSLSARGSVLAATRNSLENVDRDIRSANPLCYVTGTEVVAFETKPVSGSAFSIVDYTVDTVKKRLVYTRYAVTQTQNANPSCAVTTINGTGSTTTTWYEATPATTSRTVLSSLVGNLSTFTVPQTATFDTCATGGSTPNATTAAQAAAVTDLTVTVSLQPTSISSPVTTSDCGTYIRNFAVPSPSTTATS